MRLTKECVMKKLLPMPRAPLALMLIYGAASLIHFTHNAVFLQDYPNLPAWLSAADVYMAWLGVAAVGVAGYILMRLGQPIIGLIVVGVYAVLGLDGLAHYTRAPFAEHTAAMNFTILFEVTTAAILLGAVVTQLIKRLRTPASNAYPSG
jgi:hypothetical protein